STLAPSPMSSRHRTSSAAFRSRHSRSISSRSARTVLRFMVTKYSASSRRLMPSTPYHVRPDRCGIRRAYGPPYPVRPTTSYGPGVAASAIRRSSDSRSSVNGSLIASTSQNGSDLVHVTLIDALQYADQPIPRRLVDHAPFTHRKCRLNKPHVEPIQLPFNHAVWHALSPPGKQTSLLA